MAVMARVSGRIPPTDIEVLPVTSDDVAVLFKWACDPGAPSFLNASSTMLTHDRFVDRVQIMRSIGDLRILVRDREPVGCFLFTFRRRPDGWGWFDIYVRGRERRVEVMVHALDVIGTTIRDSHAIRKLSTSAYAYSVELIRALDDAGYIRELTTSEESWFLDRYWDRHHYSRYFSVPQ